MHTFPFDFYTMKSLLFIFATVSSQNNPTTAQSNAIPHSQNALSHCRHIYCLGTWSITWCVQPLFAISRGPTVKLLSAPCDVCSRICAGDMTVLSTSRQLSVLEAEIGEARGLSSSSHFERGNRRSTWSFLFQPFWKGYRAAITFSWEYIYIYIYIYILHSHVVWLSSVDTTTSFSTQNGTAVGRTLDEGVFYGLEKKEGEKKKENKSGWSSHHKYMFDVVI